MDLNSIWDNFLLKIKSNISSMLFETWFSETKLKAINEGIVLIIVPMHIHKKHLKENYYSLIEEIFNDVTGSIFKFDFITEEEDEKNIEIETDLGVPYENFESNLNDKYNFDNFIVGSSNKFARTTALAVAEKPGYMYNPLFIYGNSGLGKTHLMHAIGNYITKNSNKKILYVTSENFVKDFTYLHRRNNENNQDAVESFKAKYREIDVLMIDDIQYLEIASKTQQEFFNTFNELHTKNKQIIISSDRSPDDLKTLEERLRTRFNWGLTIDILPPDFALRMAIIDKKIEGHILSTYIPIDVKEFIASNCTSDIRKLEGAITRVFAYATMLGGADIDLDLAVEALENYFVKSIISKNKVDQVQQIVAEHYNVTVNDLKSKRRVAKIAVPRQIAMYVCRTELKESLPRIGLEFGGRDHTTVIHSVNKIDSIQKKDANLRLEIKKIIDRLN